MEPRIPPELHTQTATPGQVLKALREALKTGQFDFATDVNWDQSKVSRLETGKQKFIEENLEDLIRAGLIEEDGIWAKVFRAAMDRNQETSPPAPSPSRPRLKLTRPQLLAGLAVPVLLAVVVLTASRAIGSLGRVLAPSQPTKVVMGEATSTPYPTNTPYPTYTLPAKSASTSTPYPTYTPQPTYTPYPSSTPTPTVTPTPTAAVPLPFFDDFDDGLDEAWRVISGDWRMSNGWILNTEDNGQWGCITVGEESWSDYTVEVDLYDRDGSVCVTIRENRQGQWLEFRLEPNRAGWYEVSASDIKPIVTKAGGNSSFLDSPGRLLIRAEGKIFSAYLDGKLVLSVDDNNHPSGYVGLCADGPTKFNDFRVTRLE